MSEECNQRESDQRGRIAFAILGRWFEADDVSASLAAWLTSHWRRDVPTGPESGYRIRLTCTREPELPDALHAQLPATHAGEVEAATPVYETTDGERAQLLLGSHAGGAYLELDPSAARVHAWGIDAPGSPGRDALLLALHEAVRASGLLPLHCAAAVRPGDAGANVLLGASGAGKSTTLLTLAHAGWTPVCEDFAWLDPERQWAYAWDTAVRLTPDTLARLEPLRTRPAPASADPKRLLGYDELAERFGTPRRTEAPVARLVHVERGAGASRWGSLAPEAAVPAMWQAVGLPLTGYARQQVARQIGRLVRSVELGSLHVGDTPVPQRGPG